MSENPDYERRRTYWPDGNVYVHIPTGDMVISMGQYMRGDKIMHVGHDKKHYCEDDLKKVDEKNN